MTFKISHIALALGMALALSACNGSSGTDNRAGSGDGPTQGAGSSNTPGTATNGQPAAE